jgi:hypothetical protein
MLTFGEDRALVAVDLVDRPACPGRGLLGGGSCADEGLHIAGSQATVDLDLELSQPWPIVADRRTQWLVDAYPEALAVTCNEQQVLTVLVNANELQVLHRLLLGRPTQRTLPSSATRTAQATPQR